MTGQAYRQQKAIARTTKAVVVFMVGAGNPSIGAGIMDSGTAAAGLRRQENGEKEAYMADAITQPAIYAIRQGRAAPETDESSAKPGRSGQMARKNGCLKAIYPRFRAAAHVLAAMPQPAVRLYRAAFALHVSPSCWIEPACRRPRSRVVVQIGPEARLTAGLDCRPAIAEVHGHSNRHSIRDIVRQRGRGASHPGSPQSQIDREVYCR